MLCARHYKHYNLILTKDGAVRCAHGRKPSRQNLVSLTQVQQLLPMMSFPCIFHHFPFNSKKSKIGTFRSSPGFHGHTFHMIQNSEVSRRWTCRSVNSFDLLFWSRGTSAWGNFNPLVAQLVWSAGIAGVHQKLAAKIWWGSLAALAYVEVTWKTEQLWIDVDQVESMGINDTTCFYHVWYKYIYVFLYIYIYIIYLLDIFTGLWDYWMMTFWTFDDAEACWKMFVLTLWSTFMVGRQSKILLNVQEVDTLFKYDWQFRAA